MKIKMNTSELYRLIEIGLKHSTSKLKIENIEVTDVLITDSWSDVDSVTLTVKEKNDW